MECLRKLIVYDSSWAMALPNGDDGWRADERSARWIAKGIAEQSGRLIVWGRVEICSCDSYLSFDTGSRGSKKSLIAAVDQIVVELIASDTGYWMGTCFKNGVMPLRS